MSDFTELVSIYSRTLAAISFSTFAMLKRYDCIALGRGSIMLSNSLWTPDPGSHVNRKDCAADIALLAAGSVTAVNSEYIEEYTGSVGSAE